MSARADGLATKVQQANDALQAAVQSSSPEQWSAKCADSEWTQGFAGYHAATSIEGLTGMVQSMASGQFETQLESMSQIDEMNAAEWKQRGSSCTKEDALAAIRANAPKAVEMVRGLSDQQLDQKVKLLKTMPEMSVEQVVEVLMVGHAAGHTASMVNAR